MKRKNKALCTMRIGLSRSAIVVPGFSGQFCILTNAKATEKIHFLSLGTQKVTVFLSETSNAWDRKMFFNNSVLHKSPNRRQNQRQWFLLADQKMVSRFICLEALTLSGCRWDLSCVAYLCSIFLPHVIFSDHNLWTLPCRNPNPQRHKRKSHDKFNIQQSKSMTDKCTSSHIHIDQRFIWLVDTRTHTHTHRLRARKRLDYLLHERVQVQFLSLFCQTRVPQGEWDQEPGTPARERGEEREREEGKKKHKCERKELQCSHTPLWETEKNIYISPKFDFWSNLSQANVNLGTSEQIKSD